MQETGELPAHESVSAPLIPARRRSRILTWVAAACAVGFTAVYFLFVWTRSGQAFEYDVLQGCPAMLDTPAVVRARNWLSYVTEYAVAAVIVLILAIGLLRRRPALALIGTATMVLTAGVDRALVNWVFVRPRLVFDPMAHSNSFPSGHVAVAMSAVLGLLIVVPYAWRAATALVGSVFILGIAEMTMTVGWHRLSDTIGGNLLALGFACLGMALLIRRGGAHTPPVRWRPLSGMLAIIPLLGYVVWTVANGAGPAYDAVTQDMSMPISEYQTALFQVAGAIATIVSTLTVVAFLALLARIEPAPIARRSAGLLRYGKP